MATAAKIKSAIRSKSSGERRILSSLADVSSSLMSAKESSMMFDLEQQEKKGMEDTLYSGLELAGTIKGGIEQKQEIATGIKRFKEALPENLREDFRMEKTTLSDVLKGKKGSLTSYLTGKEEYFIGDKSIGSQYDVSARGDEIFSKKLTKNLLESTEGAPLMDRPTPTLAPMESMKFDMSKIGRMKPSSIQVNQEPNRYELEEKDYEEFGDVRYDKDLPPIPQHILDKFS